MRQMNKKGVIDQLGNIVIALVAVGVILVVGFLIMAEVGTQVAATSATTQTSFAGCNVENGTGCTSAINGTTTVVDSMATIPGWLPIIIITVIGSLLIGLVSAFRKSA